MMPRRESAKRQTVNAAEQLGVDLAGAPLLLENPLRRQPLIVPRDVRGGDTPEGEPAILWKLPPKLDRYGITLDWGVGGNAEQAFWGFTKLADEDETERFVAFTRRFGPLGLWPYVTRDKKKIFGLDYWVPGITEGIATPLRYTRFAGGDDYRATERAGLLGMRYEPVAEWRRWATWLRAIVSISYTLRLGEHGNSRDWEELEVAHMRVRDFATNRERQRSLLASTIQLRFLKWSGLVPALRWIDEQPTLTLALGGEEAVTMHRGSFQRAWPENTLFPALVAQLLAVITAGEHLAHCSACGELHPRSRRARVDQPAYCSDACRHEAIKKSKRESAQRARNLTAILTAISANGDKQTRTGQWRNR